MARATKITRVSFMTFSLIVFGRESSECVVLQAEVVPVLASILERARSPKLGTNFLTRGSGRRRSVALWSALRAAV
jgi:hypothetical protein